MDHLIVSSQIENLSYIGTFIVMALAGHLVPVPEEILLLLIGYASGIGLSKVYLAFAFAAAGVMAGDSALFFLSRTGSKYVDKLKNRLSPQKLERYEKLMHAHASKTIFLSRFIVGLRFFSPILAGSLKIRWKTFFWSDFPAVIIYVGGSIFLGYHFHSEIAAAITRVEFARHLIFILFVSIIGILIGLYARKRFLKRNGYNGNRKQN